MFYIFSKKRIQQFNLFSGGFLTIICPWLAFFPERLPDERTDALKIAKQRENEQQPQTPKEWLKELVEQPF